MGVIGALLGVAAFGLVAFAQGLAEVPETATALEAPSNAAAGAVDSVHAALGNAHRALGFRASLEKALEGQLQALPPGESSRPIAEELAGEYLRDGRPLEALALLVAHGEPASVPLAAALLDAGYAEAALATLDRLERGRGPLGESEDYVALFAGTAALGVGDLERAVAEFSGALAAAETDIVRQRAERGILWALVERGDLVEARRRLETSGSIARLGDSQIVLFLGERLAEGGLSETAESLYDRAADELRGTAAGAAAFEALAARRAARGDPGDAAFFLRGAEIASAGAAWEDAMRFARLALTAPGATAGIRDAARLKEALALYGSARYDECVPALERLRASSPRREIAREALIHLGRAERRRGRQDASRRHYERFLTEFRDDPFVEEVLWDLAWRDLKANKIQRALSRFREIGRRFPWGKRRHEALFREALAHVALGNAAEGAKDLARLMTLGPESSLASQTLYFRSRLARNAGRERLAATLEDSLVAGYPETFYATYVAREGASAEHAWWESPLDAEALAASAARAYSAEAEAAAARAWIGREAGEADTIASARRLRRVALLAATGRVDLLAGELRRIEEEEKDGPWRDFLMARLYRRHGLHHLSLSAGSRFANARRAPRPIEVTRLLFPAAYLDLAVRAGGESGLDPRLLLAIAREESWFEEDVVSGAGAIGLLQILPGTGRSLSQKLGEGEVTPHQLTDPWVSFHLGASYMTSLLEEFHGSLILAAAAYNGGETNAHEWEAWHRKEDPPTSIESITFTETRGYVKKILRSLWMYQALYPTESEARHGRLETKGAAE